MFAPGDYRYVLLMAAFWLWVLFGQRIAEHMGPRFASTHSRLFHAFCWLHVLLHETAHMAVAVLTGQRINDIQVRHRGGLVEFEGETLYHGLVRVAPLLWWVAAGLVMYHLMLKQAQPLWAGLGLSLLVPTLIAAATPSDGDVRGMGLLTKGFTLYVYGSIAVLVLVGLLDKVVFRFFPALRHSLFGFLG